MLTFMMIISIVMHMVIDSNGPNDDGVYDTRGCHSLLKNKGIKANIPLRNNAALWEGGDPRNKAVETLKAGEWLIYNVTVLTTSQSVWTALLRGIH